MSVHLRQSMKPQIKRGKPGDWILETLEEKEPFTIELLDELIRNIYHEVELREDAFIERARLHSSVIQLGEYRIVITQTPLSHIKEVTVIKPIVKLHVKDYALPPQLLERIEKQAEGILIAGSPGNGKTTFAEALLEVYALQNKIIKTIEVPRDLRVPEGVTQYALSHSSVDEIRDLLLLTRPDFTFFDEVRNPEDIHLFKDLRLTGIGMVGVIHAHRAIDAIQRLIGKIELGMIAQIVDTVIFIEKGQVAAVYGISYQVRVPSGMQDADLARPVIVIHDIQRQAEVYEVYTFGDEVVVMPLDPSSVEKNKLDPLQQMGIVELRRRLQAEISYPFDVIPVSGRSVQVALYKSDIPKFIGKAGVHIQALEQHLGVHIEVIEKLSEKSTEKNPIPHRIEQDKKGRVFLVPLRPVAQALLYVDERRKFIIKANKEGVFKIEKGVQASIVQRGNFTLLPI